MGSTSWVCWSCPLRNCGAGVVAGCGSFSSIRSWSSWCSPVSIFPDLYVPRSYFPHYLCSPVFMFPGPMFPYPYDPRSYAPPSLCSPIPMSPSTYAPRYLWNISSPSSLGRKRCLHVLHEIDLILYLTNEAGIHMAGQMAIFMKLTASFSMFKRGKGGPARVLTASPHLKC